MVDEQPTKDEPGKTGERLRLSLSRPGRLELKKTVETGQVRQSFSHGRSKTVQVEVKKRRTFAPGEDGGMKEVPIAPPKPEAPRPPEPAAAVRTLTRDERATRVRALEEARRIAEEDARLRAKDEDARREQDRIRLAEDAARRAVEEALRREREASGLPPEPEPIPEPTPIAAEAPPAARAGAHAGAPARATKAKSVLPAQPSVEPGRRARGAEPDEAGEEDSDRPKRPGRPEPRRPTAPARRGEPRRRAGKITVSQALDDEDRMRSLAALQRRRERERRLQLQHQEEGKPQVVRDVVIPEAITVQELANRMAVRASDVIKELMKMGSMATINQSLDTDTAELLVAEFGHKSKRIAAADVEIGLRGGRDTDTELAPRAPVVTVMGHVDHGKTSLLDALRETKVAAGEAGGITQHIGAYQVRMPDGSSVTFLDTPGHKAFTQMRARGARVTDLVVLVVAADDGVMPQTVEAINHAKAAKVPLIVAINKMDKHDANPRRVRDELLKHEVVLEEFGGDVQAVEVSATKRTNLDKLIEAILLQAEVLELQANPNRPGEGVIIEARLDRGRGPVATALVQRGSIKVGDIVVAGDHWGRVRALLDDQGASVPNAGPSVPVEILGLDGVPAAGDEMVVAENERRAREVTDFRRQRTRETRVTIGPRGTLEQFIAKIGQGGMRELPVVIKGDVQGSVEAIVTGLQRLGTDEVAARILHAAVGGIAESDVSLAKASSAIIIGFNVRASAPVRDLAAREGVDIRYYSIIYDLLDDVRGLLSGMLAPTVKEQVLGSARIKEVFTVTKVGRVAGCEVADGLIRRGAKARLLRDSAVVHTGRIGTLKRFKDDVREVRSGLECGIGLENFNDFQAGDVIEAYEETEVARTLEA
ncbi:MAG: translation initiation factor IF-2 [Alphaproteobacteria bacterium]|nr:translation initiation factor IF-2 [Alphaproteobacteria bacterium]